MGAGAAKYKYAGVVMAHDAKEKPDGPVIAVEIRLNSYDPKTGLPAANIVAGDEPGTEVVFKGVYDYPEKLEIEDHPDAPLVRMR